VLALCGLLGLDGCNLGRGLVVGAALALGDLGLTSGLLLGALEGLLARGGLRLLGGELALVLLLEAAGVLELGAEEEQLLVLAAVLL
jgi:hypothetical protein